MDTMGSKLGHSCVVGPRTRVSGTLSGEQDLLVSGFVEGRVELAAELVLSSQGELHAELQVDRAALAGRVCGDIKVRERLVIEAGARVQGQITASSLVISPGALVFGEVVMEVELPAEAIALRG